MKEVSFDNKTIIFAEAICSAYKDEEGRGSYPKLDMKEEDLTEDFTAMLWAQMMFYKRITGEEDVDIFAFIGVLNHMAVQRMMEVWGIGEDGEKAAAKKDYEHAANRILDVLGKCKMPVTWHENRPELLQTVAQELARLEREGA